MYTPTLDYMGFQMGPPLSIFQFGTIFTINLKRVYLDYFISNSANLGDQV